MTKSTSLQRLISRAIMDKTGDAYAARLEVAQSVQEALRLGQFRCPVCGGQGYASPKVSPWCRACSQPMQPDGRL